MKSSKVKLLCVYHVVLNYTEETCRIKAKVDGGDWGFESLN